MARQQQGRFRQMTNDIDAKIVKLLQKHYREYEASRPFLDWLASRTNDAAETSVDRMMQMGQLSRSDAVWLGKKLEEYGCSVFISGRKGYKSRVAWEYSLRSVGKAAIGKSQVLEELDPDIQADAIDQQALNPTVVAAEQDNELRISVDEAKRGLAATFGVPPSAIEITVRV